MQEVFSKADRFAPTPGPRSGLNPRDSIVLTELLLICYITHAFPIVDEVNVSEEKTKKRKGEVQMRESIGQVLVPMSCSQQDELF